MLPTPFLFEQTVKKQITIAAGATGTNTLTLPKEVQGGLKGYGYTWYTSNTFALVADQIIFPTRTDQEGSASIPRIFEQHVPIKAGGSISLTIVNSDSAEHTYDVTFYLYTSRMLPNTAAYQSDGGELIISTGSSSSVANNAVIYNSSLTTAANVTALGLAVNVSAPLTLLQGDATAGAAAAALAGSTACKEIDIMPALDAATDTNGTAIFVGNATSQTYPLAPGQAHPLRIDNLADIYIKRAGASDVTVHYIGS
jgi:hypothetical protein